MLLVLLSVLPQALPPWATGESLGEDLAISFVTIGPGDELISWAGHAALVVEDRRLRQERLYNYGAFEGGDGYFLRYLRGQIDVFVADTADVSAAYTAYRLQNRDVKIQELSFTPEQRLAIAQALAQNVLPQNRRYPYRHFWDNCSTRPRDILDRAWGGQLRAATHVPAPLTVRQLARNYARVNPPMSLVLDALQNDELDRPITQWEYGFLPYELERQLNALKVNGEPAVKLQWNFNLARGRELPPEGPLEWTWLLLGIGIALGLTGLVLDRFEAARGFHVVFGLIAGTLGTALFVAALFTEQTVTWRNENLFLFNPLALALVPLGLLRTPAARKWLIRTWSALAICALLGLVLKALPMFDQHNWNLIALVLPICVAMAVPRK